MRRSYPHRAHTGETPRSQVPRVRLLCRGLTPGGNAGHGKHVGSEVYSECSAVRAATAHAMAQLKRLKRPAALQRAQHAIARKYGSDDDDE